jgi:hypothetical protein
MQLAKLAPVGHLSPSVPSKVRIDRKARSRAQTSCLCTVHSRRVGGFLFEYRPIHLLPDVPPFRPDGHDPSPGACLSRRNGLAWGLEPFARRGPCADPDATRNLAQDEHRSGGDQPPGDDSEATFTDSGRYRSAQPCIGRGWHMGLSASARERRELCRGHRQRLLRGVPILPLDVAGDGRHRVAVERLTSRAGRSRSAATASGRMGAMAEHVSHVRCVTG